MSRLILIQDLMLVNYRSEIEDVRLFGERVKE